MKKTMMKFLCALLTFALLLTMAGCGSDEKRIIGTWEADIDCGKWFMDSFNEGLGSGDEAEKMAEYFKIDSFEMTFYMTFHEDDTYALGIREETFRTAVEGVKEDIQKGLEDYLLDELKPVFGDELSADDVGELIEPLMEQAFGEEAMEQMLQGLQETTTEGRYRIEDGKICISKDLEEEIGSDYDTYKLSGSKLTLLECFCEIDNEDAANWTKELYPMEFNKVD